MAEIVMPRLSDTMEEGTILRWLAHEGDHISRGAELVEIETDKATMVYESDQDGVLELLAQEGATLAVGAVIARVRSAGEAPAEAPAESQSARAPSTPPAPSAAGAPSAPAPARATPPRAPQPPVPPATPSASDGAGAAAPAASEAQRVKASPLARRIAREAGIDLRTLAGSGPGGRIVKSDVQAAGRPATAVPAAGVKDVATAKGSARTVELSRMQQTIARRMAESKATIPHFSLQASVDMEECVKLRSQLKELAQPHVPTYNDMVVKACALALREHPRVNSSYRDGRLEMYSRVNVGVAVAAREALVVPTVFDADEKSLGEIARETRSLAERVREATITPPELGGGTFTVSNLGMYGISSFTAIINPPQSAILAVGALALGASVRDGVIAARHAMTLTLACDHRVLYGADAAQFLDRIRELLQTPAALTL